MRTYPFSLSITAIPKMYFILIIKKFTESKIRQLEDNAKYFMGQFQPLIDENYKLKDTIVNMNSALRLAHELAIELVRKENPKGESRESKL